MNRIINNLNKAQEDYGKKVGAVVQQLQPYIGFAFDIFWMPGDGWVISYDDESQVAPLSRCLDTIKKKGKLSISDFQKNII